MLLELPVELRRDDSVLDEIVELSFALEGEGLVLLPDWSNDTLVRCLLLVGAGCFAASRPHRGRYLIAGRSATHLDVAPGHTVAATIYLRYGRIAIGLEALDVVDPLAVIQDQVLLVIVRVLERTDAKLPDRRLLVLEPAHSVLCLVVQVPILEKSG